MTGPVAIVGAGRAGRGLARALRTSGVQVAGLHARRARPDDEDGAAAGTLAATVGPATVVLVAVQDAVLGAALAEVAAARFAPATVILQLSGSADDALLGVVRARGHPAGTFHPLVPLSAPERAAGLLRGAWIGIGGDDRAVAVAGQLAASLGAHTLPLPSEAGARARYHAGAVVASNFPVALAALAERLLGEGGVPADAARAAVWHLMSSAIGNLRGHAPADVLTGPVVRGDAVTVQRHLAAIEHDAAALEVYVALTRLTQQVAGGAVPLPGAREISQVIADAERRLAAGEPTRWRGDE